MPRRTFVIELASDARFASDLSAGGVFVALTGVTVLDEIDLVVRGQAGELCVLARVVYIDPAAGCGLELAGFGPELKEQLAQLAATPAEVAAVAGTRARRRRVLSRHPRAVKDSIEMIALDEAGGGDDDGGDDGGDDSGDDDGDDGECDADEAGADDGVAVARTASGRIPLNATERLRDLSLAEQLKVARGPSASERMALERMYGKNVWEALLRNPGLTTPEVARLARLGTLPRVLLETIVTNSTWLQVPEIRRALLANPRLGTDQVVRVLRVLPKHELKLAATIPAYPHSVRSAAKKLLDE